VTGFPKVKYRRGKRPQPSATLKAAVLSRDGFRCVIAGPNCTGVATDLDHRAGRGAGGSEVLNQPECAVAACRSCNGGKEDADGTYRRDLIARGVRVVKAATNEGTADRCKALPVEYADGWYELLGFERFPVSKYEVYRMFADAGFPRPGLGVIF